VRLRLRCGIDVGELRVCLSVVIWQDDFSSKIECCVCLAISVPDNDNIHLDGHHVMTAL
jgi:hypothetical protein